MKLLLVLLLISCGPPEGYTVHKIGDMTSYSKRLENGWLIQAHTFDSNGDSGQQISSSLILLQRRENKRANDPLYLA